MISLREAYHDSTGHILTMIQLILIPFFSFSETFTESQPPQSMPKSDEMLPKRWFLILTMDNVCINKSDFRACQGHRWVDQNVDRASPSPVSPPPRLLSVLAHAWGHQHRMCCPGCTSWAPGRSCWAAQGCQPQRISKLGIGGGFCTQ